MARTKRPTATPTKSAKHSRTKATTKPKPPSTSKPPTKPKVKKKSKPKTTSDSPHQTLFFHHESHTVTGFLAPWYPSPFKLDGQAYRSVGHYIMAEKARLFKDTKTLAAILASKSADEQKELGNSVKGFKFEVWRDHAPIAASTANEHKFLHGRQAASLRKKLLPYARHSLVYASPTDHFFGIGCSAEEAVGVGRARWGENVFGHSFWWVKERVWREGHPEEAEREEEEGWRERCREIDRLVHW